MIRSKSGRLALLSSQRRGFTLNELLVVISVLGVLLSTIRPGIQDSRAQAESNARTDLQELCRQLQFYLWNFENPIPTDLVSIIDRLPDRFQPLVEGDGPPVDVVANGFRYYLEISPFYQQSSYFQRNRGEIRFSIWAEPSSSLRLNSRFCINHRKQLGESDCYIIEEHKYDEPFDPQKLQIIEKIGVRFLSEAQRDNVPPEDVASFLHAIDGDSLKKFAADAIDTNKDGAISLQEIKDLEEVPLIGEYVKDWSEFYAIGRYGERIDQIAVPIDTLQFSAQPTAFLGEYHGLSGMLKLAIPEGSANGIAGSVKAAQLAVDMQDTNREVQHMMVISDKGEVSWLKGDLSTDALNFIEYSVDVRKAYLDDGAP